MCLFYFFLKKNNRFFSRIFIFIFSTKMTSLAACFSTCEFTKNYVISTFIFACSCNLAVRAPISLFIYGLFEVGIMETYTRDNFINLFFQLFLGIFTSLVSFIITIVYLSIKGLLPPDYIKTLFKIPKLFSYTLIHEKINYSNISLVRSSVQQFVLYLLFSVVYCSLTDHPTLSGFISTTIIVFVLLISVYFNLMNNKWQAKRLKLEDAGEELKPALQILTVMQLIFLGNSLTFLLSSFFTFYWDIMPRFYLALVLCLVQMLLNERFILNVILIPLKKFK